MIFTTIVARHRAQSVACSKSRKIEKQMLHVREEKCLSYRENKNGSVVIMALAVAVKSGVLDFHQVEFALIILLLRCEALLCLQHGQAMLFVSRQFQVLVSGVLIFKNRIMLITAIMCHSNYVNYIMITVTVAVDRI